MSENRYLTISALTRYIKTKLENDPHLHTVLLKGEISNFKHHGRGHMYFTLKDSNSRIAAVMFAGNNKTLKFLPEDGMKVLVQGEISLYEPSGTYQIYVKKMDPDGIGNLYLAYEQLKRKLEEEGLFSSTYKKAIPTYPKKIGVITSPTGAAVRDVITTIRRRYPIAKILVFPTLVQGGQAAPSIVSSIEKANAMEDVDVLIVGRGGGSIEELWAFNEEIVARAIAASNIPIISAVGHETDVTIADFVADLRAPTPTGAAELAVPSMIELAEKLHQREARLHRAARGLVNEKKAQLEKLQQSYAFRYPEQIYKQKEQQLDRLIEKLQQRTDLLVQQKKSTIERVEGRLQTHHPKHRVDQVLTNYQHMEKNFHKAMALLVKQKQSDFDGAVSKLEAVSPLKIMSRGYSLVYNEKEKIIKSVEDTNVGSQLTLQMQDGRVHCQVSDIVSSAELGKV